MALKKKKAFSKKKHLTTIDVKEVIIYCYDVILYQCIL
jgi:hypothetical protein